MPKKCWEVSKVQVDIALRDYCKPSRMIIANEEINSRGRNNVHLSLNRRILRRSFISRFWLKHRGGRFGFARLLAINAGLGLECAKRPVCDRREKLTVAPFRGTFLLHLSVPNFYRRNRGRISSFPYVVTRPFLQVMNKL